METGKVGFLYSSCTMVFATLILSLHKITTVSEIIYFLNFTSALFFFFCCNYVRISIPLLHRNVTGTTSIRCRYYAMIINQHDNKANKIINPHNITV